MNRIVAGFCSSDSSLTAGRGESQIQEIRLPAIFTSTAILLYLGVVLLTFAPALAQNTPQGETSTRDTTLALPDSSLGITLPDSTTLNHAVTVEHSAGEDTLFLDLIAALRIAGEGAPDAVRTKMSEESSRLTWRASVIERYYPAIDLSLQVPSLNEQLVENLSYNPVDSTYISQWVNSRDERWLGGLRMTQPLPTGGEIDLSSTFYQRLYRFGPEDNLDETHEVRQNWRLELSQELFRGNQTRISERKADWSYRKTRWGSSHAMRALAYRVLEAFYTLEMSRQELEISQEDLDAARETASIARRKYEAGLIPEVDALQLEVEVLQKEADLSNSVASQETRLEQFKETLGLDLERPVVIQGNPRFREFSIDLAEATGKALAEREDIRQAELDVRLAEEGVKDARRPYIPSGRLSAFYDLDRRDETWDENFHSNPDDFAKNRGLTFTISSPLWTSGRRSVAVQQAKIGLRRSRFEEEQLQRDVILEVRQSVRSLDEAKRRYQLSLRSQEISESSFAMTRDRFENGQVTAREWIDAQIALKRSRINTLRALVDHTLAVAKVRLAIGENVVEDLDTEDSSPGR